MQLFLIITKHDFVIVCILRIIRLIIFLTNYKVYVTKNLFFLFFQLLYISKTNKENINALEVVYFF